VTARNAILYVGGAVVMIAVIGAIYLEILVQSRSTHDVWMVTQDVPAGALLTTDNVRQASVPDTGDHILYYTGSPVADHRRAGHSLRSGHMLADDDLLQTEMVLVPVSFKAAPPLNRGEFIDVYTQLGTKTIQVGKSLAVESATTIWVPAVEEPSWITLQANNAPLFAAASSGVGVPGGAGQGIQDAVSSLAGTISGPSGLTPAPTILRPSGRVPQRSGMASSWADPRGTTVPGMSKGSSAVTAVPRSRTLRMVNVPPASSARSRIEASPTFPSSRNTRASAGSKPRPSSTTSTRREPGELSMWTCTLEARACLATFDRASCTTR